MNKTIINKVCEVNELEFTSTISNFMINNKPYIVEIEGNEIQSWYDYILKIQESFKLPSSCIDSVDRYLDWMRDLSWLDAQGYVLVIRNFKSFLQKELILKKQIVEDFTDIILPFWQEEVEKVVVGGMAKDFKVYLIS